MSTFEAWNLRLLQTYFAPGAGGREVFLNTTPEELDRIGAGLGGDAGFLEARRCHRRVVRPDQRRSPTRTGSAIPAGQEGDCDRQRQVTPRPFPRLNALDPPGGHLPNLRRIRVGASGGTPRGRAP